MTSDKFRECNDQPCHADMLYLGQLSVIIYITANPEPLMTQFLNAQLMGPDVVNSKFSVQDLKSINYHTTPIAKEDLRMAVMERFSPVFKQKNVTNFMNSFTQPTVLDGIDDVLQEDSYRICCFRPDLLHYGPVIPPSWPNENQRKTLFFSLMETCKNEVEQSNANDNYEIQFHPVNMFRMVQSKGKVNLDNAFPNAACTTLTEKDVLNLYRDYLPAEILALLEFKPQSERKNRNNKKKIN